MSRIPHAPEGANGNGPAGETTAREIYHQPFLWLDTFNRTLENPWSGWRETGIICGAGTSAYAAAAIQAAWPQARAIATTDLLTDSRPLRNAAFLVSIARSGDSPESVAVADLASRNFPNLAQLAITCNSRGQLAQRQQSRVLLLDPRTNDRSLVMTSSFSNLVLAGLALSHGSIFREHLDAICRWTEHHLAGLDALAKQVAKWRPERAVVLASSPLYPWAQETSLKIMEMTAGRVATIHETYLGLRHGPMAFVDRETLVLCLASTDPQRRMYEADLLNELEAKQLGRVVCITPGDFSGARIDTRVMAVAPELPDELRTPFEIVFPQLLAFHLSLGLGLNPDAPSPDGIINRVVSGVKIY